MINSAGRLNPSLKFRINKKLDKKIGLVFLEHKKAGFDFGKKIILLHPKLQKAVGSPKNQKEKMIGKYVGDFYAKNKKEILKTKEKFQKEWDQKAPRFFSLTDKIFNHHPWPQGKYLAFLSIFNCNPRFLETKTFQVFWKHKRGSVSVSTHEMLHFMFYDYLEKCFPQAKKISSEKIWKLSEIINFFILNSSPFRQLIGRKENLYPDLHSLANKLKPIWKESKNINDFFLPSIKFLQKT